MIGKVIGLSLAALLVVASVAGCSSDSSSDSSGGAAGMTGSAGSSGAGGGSASGPGASLKCKSSGKNAYDTYGMSAFLAVNDQIFTNVNAEVTANGTKNVGDSFTKIGTGNPPSTADDAATFKKRLGAFLVFAYGGPNTYDGPDMVTAHTGMNITMDQYTYFVSNIVVPALTAKGVPMDDVSSCFAPVVLDPAFVSTIVGH